MNVVAGKLMQLVQHLYTVAQLFNTCYHCHKLCNEYLVLNMSFAFSWHIMQAKCYKS